MCLVAKLCLALCDSVDCSPPGSSVHGDSPGKNTEVGCLALLQGIFLTQGSNPGLPHCRWILYHLSHKNTGVGSLSILWENFPIQEMKQGLLHCRWILSQLSFPTLYRFISSYFTLFDVMVHGIVSLIFLTVNFYL